MFGGVYKLAAVELDDGTIQPKIKISENTGKITNPHFKKLYRFFGNDTGKAIADYLCVYDETVDDSQDLVIFDPENVADTADYPGLGMPNGAPEGISYVIVGGEIAAKDGKPAAMSAGRTLKI